MKKKYLEEFLATLLLILMVATSFLFIAVIGKLITVDKVNYNWLLIVGAYVVAVVIIGIIDKKFKTRISRVAFLITSFPIAIIHLFLSIEIIFQTLWVHLGFYLILCFLIPFLLLNTYEFLNFPALNAELYLYILLTSTVIFSVILLRQFRYLVYKFSPIRFQNSEKLKPYELDKLSDYIISVNNVKLAIFFTYFVLLIATNLFDLQGVNFYGSDKFDKAVLQSFVTYIAFDRIVSLAKQVEFKPSELVMKIMNSWQNKLKQQEETPVTEPDSDESV